MSPRHWVIIPAAGIGTRMRADRPKQYLQLAGKSVLEHTLAIFLDHPRIDGLVLALAAGDPWWPALGIRHAKLQLAEGGAERCDTVLHALDAIAGQAAAEDWVLVHDAARPCLRRSDLDLLLDTLKGHPCGGLLGIPIADTIKRSNAQNEVEATVPRDGLWRALTPQMFRYAALRKALQQARDRGLHVTDDASAMELAGQQPLMVEGHGDNIKITRPEDRLLAELYLTDHQGLA
ncbi:MAG: 2-C-methyl-D-erythritol 4-phosphate cytidylyltransferase [Thiohalomonadaceae bacterium]